MAEATINQKLLGWIEEDREILVDFLSRFVRIPSPNPPGDTRDVATWLVNYLKERDLSVEVLHGQEHLPNLVASFDGAAPGPHLVLNGHIDVFPSGPAEQWSRDPWSGVVENGRLYGRGVADMKCGTAASIWTYICLHRLRHDLRGKLTLTVVSDEETGGEWGARWLLDNLGDRVKGDCVLNGEPTSPGAICLGEKGSIRFAVEVTTPGSHAALTHQSANAIQVASELIGELYKLQDWPVVQSENVRNTLEATGPAVEASWGKGAARILNQVTVCVGVIHGGDKINMLPGNCRFEVDIRTPIGVAPAEVANRIEEIVSQHPAKVVPIWANREANLSPVDHPMIGILQKTVTDLGWEQPQPMMIHGGTDCRFWRDRGVPAYVYGCKATNMARPDEYVELEEYFHVIRTHALAAAAYLAT